MKVLLQNAVTTNRRTVFKIEIGLLSYSEEFHLFQIPNKKSNQWKNIQNDVGK